MKKLVKEKSYKIPEDRVQGFWDYLGEITSLADRDDIWRGFKMIFCEKDEITIDEISNDFTLICKDGPGNYFVSIKSNNCFHWLALNSKITPNHLSINSVGFYSTLKDLAGFLELSYNEVYVFDSHIEATEFALKELKSETTTKG